MPTRIWEMWGGWYAIIWFVIIPILICVWASSGVWLPLIDVTVSPSPLDPYNGVLTVTNGTGQGSCVVIAEYEGWWYAVTAQHVIDRGIGSLQVDWAYEIEIVRIDPQMDLALIRFQSSVRYNTYKVAEAKAGEPCTAIGWHGGPDQWVRAQYEGHVIAPYWITGLTAANTGVFPGCSGGALFNADMEIIGITVEIGSARGTLFDSTVFSVPGQYVQALKVVIPAVHELMGD